MGINGLLPALKPITKHVHIGSYKGERVVVDGYSWLHRGAYSCARELCEGIWTDKYVAYFLARIQLLRSHGVEPIAVFDGGRLPIKGDEEQSRHRARAEARERAAVHLAAGNTAAAVDCYQRCVDITPAMAKCVIEALKAEGVSFIVAPYEADAQMAYLAKQGKVHAVVTEDSDLVAYGCPRVLYKLDRSGAGEELCLQDLPNCPGLPLSSFTSDQFLQLCILAGCDFLQQLPGIGLKKAHGAMRKYRTFTQVVKMLRFNGTRVPADYEVRFQLAIWAFRHCRVYCPESQGLVHLEPMPGGGLGSADVDVPAALLHLEQQQQSVSLDFLGPQLEQEVARGIAEGHLDPTTHKPFDLAKLYDGCPNLPPHIAAQIAPVPHLLALRSTADAQASGKQQGGSGSGPGSGGGRPRVGLSKKHSGQGKGKGSAGAAAGFSAGGRRKSGGGGSAAAAADGGCSGGGGKRQSSLGIAKYFAAAPAAAESRENAGRQVAAGTAQGPAGASQRPATIALLPGSSSVAVAAAPGTTEGETAAARLQQSISAAVQALQQEQQRRQQLQHAEKQQFLTELQQQQQQVAAASASAAGGGCPDEPAAEAMQEGPAGEHVGSCLPAAKRQRCSLEPEDAAPTASSIGSLGLAAGLIDAAAYSGPDLQQLSAEAAAFEAAVIAGSGRAYSIQLMCSNGSSSGMELPSPAAAAATAGELLGPQRQQQSQWLLLHPLEGGGSEVLLGSSKGAPVSAMTALTQVTAQAPRAAAAAEDEQDDAEDGWLRGFSSSAEQEAGRGMFGSLQQQLRQERQPAGRRSYVGSRFFGSVAAAPGGSGSLQDSLLSLPGVSGLPNEGLGMGSGSRGLLGPGSSQGRGGFVMMGADEEEDDFAGATAAGDGLDGDVDVVVSPPRRHELALGGSGALNNAGSGGGSWRRLQQSLQRGSVGGVSRRGSLLLNQLGSDGGDNGAQAAAEPPRFSRFRAQLSSQTQQQHQQQQEQQQLGVADMDDMVKDFELRDQQWLQQPAVGAVLADGAASGSPDSLGAGDSLQQQLRDGNGLHAHADYVVCSARDASAATGAAAAASGGSDCSSSDSGADGNDENVAPAADAFHSIGHVRGFAKLAAKTVKKVQQQQQQREAAGAGPAAASFERFACSQRKGAGAGQQGQLRAPLQPAPVNGAAAATQQQLLQQQHVAGGVLRPSGLLRKRSSAFFGDQQQQETNLVGAAAAGDDDEQPSAAVRKPFRAPWLRSAGAAAAPTGSGSSSPSPPSLSPSSDSKECLHGTHTFAAQEDDDDVLITCEVAPLPAGMGGAGLRGGGFGTFGSFACGGGGGGGSQGGSGAAGAGGLLRRRQKQGLKSAAAGHGRQQLR